MTTGLTLLICGLLLVLLAVVDWRVGGLQLWWRVLMFGRFSRGQALAETYEGLRGSLGSRLISVLITLAGVLGITLGLIRLIGRTP